MTLKLTLIAVQQMARLAACEVILIARPCVEIKPNRNFSEQSEFPFEQSYKGHQNVIGRHEDTAWRDALSCGVVGTERVASLRVDSKPIAARRRDTRGWGSMAS